MLDYVVGQEQVLVIDTSKVVVVIEYSVLESSDVLWIGLRVEICIMEIRNFVVACHNSRRQIPDGRSLNRWNRHSSIGICPLPVSTSEDVSVG